MKIIVGLGNPGREYERTRHNIGFEITNELVRRLQGVSQRSRFRANVREGVLGSTKFIVAQRLEFSKLFVDLVNDREQCFNVFFRFRPKNFL